MKKLLALMAVAGFMTACNSGDDENKNTDTASVNSPVTDTSTTNGTVTGTDTSMRTDTSMHGTGTDTARRGR